MTQKFERFLFFFRFFDFVLIATPPATFALVLSATWGFFLAPSSLLSIVKRADKKKDRMGLSPTSLVGPHWLSRPHIISQLGFPLDISSLKRAPSIAASPPQLSITNDQINHRFMSIFQNTIATNSKRRPNTRNQTVPSCFPSIFKFSFLFSFFLNKKQINRLTRNKQFNTFPSFSCLSDRATDQMSNVTISLKSDRTGQESSVT